MQNFAQLIIEEKPKHVGYNHASAFVYISKV